MQRPGGRSFPATESEAQVCTAWGTKTLAGAFSLMVHLLPSVNTLSVCLIY